MADLVTHLATALIPGVALPRAQAALLAAGVTLPDLGGRVPGLAREVLEALGLATADGLHVPFAVLHQPIGGVLAGVLLAWLLPQTERANAAFLLGLGVFLHLAVDVLQDHHGLGYHLLAPVHFGRFELGCIGSEATVPWAPWLALATALVWAARWAWQRRNQAG